MLRKNLLTLWLVALVAASPAFAQGTTSRLLGVVTDQTGAVVPGATVTLTNEATGVSFTTVTTGAGTYTFEAIQVGTYTVAVELQGFKKFVARGNPINISEPTTVNVKLEPGGIEQQVEVTAAAPVVQTSTSGNIGTTFEQRTIESLPIIGGRGRNPLDLVLTQPGVVSGANTGGGTHVYGARDRSWNFTLDGIRPLVERYFGALPTHGPMEHFVDRHIRPPDGAVTRVVRKGTAPKAYQRIIFHGPFDYSWEHRLELDALQQLLDMRLRDALREDKGGTYGVGVSASGSWIPYRHYSVALSFGSAPERTEELAAAAFAVIDSVKRAGPTDDEMAKIRETLLRSHETGLRENAAWIGWMSDHDEDGRDLHTIVQYPSLVQRLTADQVREAARRYLNLTQYARFTLLPEGAPKPAP